MRIKLVLLLVCLITSINLAADLEYAPAPADNPLKGFTPYTGAARNFPHTLEFNYLSMRDLMPGPDQFNWQPLDNLLKDVASRKCQTVFRVYMEYPGKPTGVPQFLLDNGLKLIEYTDKKSRKNATPDYTNPIIKPALEKFIAAMGERYDSDPRVAYITAGFLGWWGEWHDSDHKELWAPIELQSFVMAAYEKSFKHVPVLLRYPAGENDDEKRAANASASFGYHDDSFGWSTLATTKPSDAHFFMSLMQRAGPEAMNKWRKFPIGGETRPEIWPKLWDEPSDTPAGQEFMPCIEGTHVTWLMDSSISKQALTPEQRARAIAAVVRMGYELHVATADASINKSSHELTVALTLQNRGVAPFYRDWPVELGLIDSSGKVAQSWKPEWKINGLQPDDPARKWDFHTAVANLPAGKYRVAIQVPNPMPKGQPVKFANKTQDADLPGWLTVANLEN